ncbi:hypothetical protein PR048_029440 [Dryococelus australis]|uniref:Uncharacterized protein n=1 Tax=Dryococelus australis TaxID=614101 RepID=A0ABQ9GFV0_9NEOP|nr:hypothetical protein PR048_029440 [Dryococelus australis]
MAAQSSRSVVMSNWLLRAAKDSLLVRMAAGNRVFQDQVSALYTRGTSLRPVACPRAILVVRGVQLALRATFFQERLLTRLRGVYILQGGGVRSLAWLSGAAGTRLHFLRFLGDIPFPPPSCTPALLHTRHTSPPFYLRSTQNEALAPCLPRSIRVGPTSDRLYTKLVVFVHRFRSEDIVPRLVVPYPVVPTTDARLRTQLGTNEQDPWRGIAFRESNVS